MTVLNLQCGESADDKAEDFIGVSLTASLTCGSWGWGFDLGLRFPGVSGLSGATISAATLTFRAIETDSGPFVADWYAEDGAAPAIFTTATNSVGDRTRTTATCEGDGADFGAWTDGQDETFTDDGTNTIADIIQELADSYDPSAIVLLCIHTSGYGNRRSKSYDDDSALAPKLDITYTAGGGDQTATPTPVAVPLTVPTPTSVGGTGTVTMTPSAIQVPVSVPTPTLSIGGMTMTPTPVAVPLTVPTPSQSIGAVTLTPTPVAVPIAVPTPTVVGGTTIYPTPVLVPLSVPTPTRVIGGVTLTPTPVVVPIVVPTPSLPVAMNPTPVVVSIAIPTPSWSIGTVTMTPTPVAVPIAIPEPVVSGPGVTRQYTQLGDIERWIDPDQYSPDAVCFIEVGLATFSALTPAYARLYNVTDGQAIGGSEVSTSSTTFAVLRSGTFSLSSGLRQYRIEFGGEPGSAYFCWGGDVGVLAS